MADDTAQLAPPTGGVPVAGQVLPPPNAPPATLTDPTIPVPAATPTSAVEPPAPPTLPSAMATEAAQVPLAAPSIPAALSLAAPSLAAPSLPAVQPAARAVPAAPATPIVSPRPQTRPKHAGRILRRLALVAALGVGGVVGGPRLIDEIRDSPSTAPVNAAPAPGDATLPDASAVERGAPAPAAAAASVEYRRRDPATGATAVVVKDLADGVVRAEVNGVVLTHFDGDEYVLTGHGWTLAFPGQEHLFATARLAFWSPPILMFDDVLPPEVSPYLTIDAQASVDSTPIGFVVDEPFDLAARLAASSTASSVTRSAVPPVPEVVVERNPAVSEFGPIEYQLRLDRAGFTTAHPDRATDLALAGDTEVELVVTVDPSGVVLALTAPAATTILPGGYELTAVWTEPQSPLAAFGVDEPEPIARTPDGDYDYEFEARAAIGDDAYDRLVAATGVWIESGEASLGIANAIVERRGGESTMWIQVQTVGSRELLHLTLAHELGHIAMYGAGYSDLERAEVECIADIVGGHWLGQELDGGSYAYTSCEPSATTQAIIDRFG